jgi:hypothetical protein
MKESVASCEEMMTLGVVLWDEISPTLLTLRITVESLVCSKFTSDEVFCFESKILKIRMNQKVHKSLISDHWVGSTGIKVVLFWCLKTCFRYLVLAYCTLNKAVR